MSSPHDKKYDSDSDESSDGFDDELDTGAPGEKKKKKGGSSCHQYKKNKRCRKKFCGHCLKKFYKESASAITDKTAWKCPSCRKICCCAACRRRKVKDGSGDAFDDSFDMLDKSPKKKKIKTNTSSSSKLDSESFCYPPIPLCLSPSHSPDSRLPELRPLDSPESPEQSSSEDDASDTDDEHAPPSSHFTTMLSNHIKKLAEEAQRDPNTPFAKLYKEAQSKPIKRKIRSILLAEDMKKEKKVEIIASFLVPLQSASSTPTK